MGRGVHYSWIILICVALSSCADDADMRMPKSGPLVSQGSETPLSRPADIAASNVLSQTSVSTAPIGRSKAEIYRGTGNLVGSPGQTVAKADMTADGSITLNFVNADVKDVVKTVLGDYLKLNYVIGANVQGPVTVQTSRPLQPSAVLPVLEQTLRLNGFAIVKAGETYKVLPIADAAKEAQIPSVSGRGSRQPGFGIEIVPMRYVNVAEVQKLLAPLVPATGILYVDTARNVMMIGGTEQERAMILDNIALFDVDWLAGMSFALFTPQYTDADSLARELNLVIGGKNGPLNGMVRIVPMQRLNAILAISTQSRYLDRIETWVQRLDQPGEGTDKRIFVYHVQNGRAADLASTLTKVLGKVSAKAAPTQQAQFGQDTSDEADAAMAPTEGPYPPPGNVAYQAAPASNGNEGVAVAGLGNVTITADETNNALVVMASPAEYSSIEAALRQLDIVPLQVLLEAAIVEVTLTDDLKYGVQYYLNSSDRNQVVLTRANSSFVGPNFPGFSYLYSSGGAIRVALDALSSITRVDVISSPQVLVLNNQTATLQVGDQVPIATAQAVNVTTSNAPIVNSIEYHDTGVILKVTPRVNQGGMVMLDVSQEVSDVAPTDSSTLNSPTIQQRKINSSVAIQDGETIALGGLIKDSKTRSRGGIPLLKDIPVLGNIFRTTGENKGRTELLVLITPHVVDNVEKARLITEEFRQKLPSVQRLLNPEK